MSALLEAILESDSVTHGGSKGRERCDGRTSRHLRLDKREEARRRCLPVVPRVTRPRGLRSVLLVGIPRVFRDGVNWENGQLTESEEMNRRVEITKNTKPRYQWRRSSRGTKKKIRVFLVKKWTSNSSKACAVGKPMV